MLIHDGYNSTDKKSKPEIVSDWVHSSWCVCDHVYLGQVMEDTIN